MLKFILSLTFACTLFASDGWTKEQKWTQAAYLTVTTIDMLQTISFRAEGKPEGNPLLGRYPSKEKVIIFIVGGMALHTYITDLLPSEYRKYWQYVWIGIETWAISHNHFKAGVRIKF